MKGGDKKTAEIKKNVDGAAVRRSVKKDVKKHGWDPHSLFACEQEEIVSPNLDGDLPGATDAFFEARELLKKTVRFLKQSGFDNESAAFLQENLTARSKELLNLKKIINIHDGMLFFPRRKGNLSLKPVKTSLVWQDGEYPVFKQRVRHYRLSSSPEIVKAEHKSRRFAHLSVLDAVSGEYKKFELPEEEPIGRNGTLYVSNVNLLFRVNSRYTFYIPHYRAVQRKFYADAFEVVHISGGRICADVFIPEEEEVCRLLDIIIQSLD